MERLSAKPALPATRFWERRDIERRLHRVEGQVRGLGAMLGRDAGCEEMLTQLRAVRGALLAVERIVETCGAVECLERELGPFDPERVREALSSRGRGGSEAEGARADAASRGPTAHPSDMAGRGSGDVG